ncbi:TolC family protein, partial [Bacteroidales bacterium OttesenSCG-928-I14]|nr:TolC family protein [Bacteroidales bacterium OttesenSCG-928-I14]
NNLVEASGEQPILNDKFNHQIKDRFNQSVSLNLNIPIFNRFTVRNQVRASKLNVQNQKLELNTVHKNLYKEIQTAYLNATAAQEKYHSAQKAIKASKEAFNYARVRYDSGASTAYEFNEARTNLMHAQSEELKAKYDYILRAKILDFYNGIPIKL